MNELIPNFTDFNKHKQRLVLSDVLPGKFIIPNNLKYSTDQLHFSCGCRLTKLELPNREKNPKGSM
jgi:hypothetical protein